MIARGLLSLSLALYPPEAPVRSDVGMDKHFSSAGSDFQPWDRGVLGGGFEEGGGSTIFLFLPSFPLNTS